MNNYKLYTTNKRKILDVMKIIEKNKKKFVIILKKNNIEGIVTDGDIRRQLIRGDSVYDDVQPRTDFLFLKTGFSLEEAKLKFAEREIDILPVLNGKEVVDIVRRYEFEHSLFRDVLNNAINEYPIKETKLEFRPWGVFKTLFENNFLHIKMLNVFPGESLSYQMHHHRNEHWVIVKGKGEFVLDSDITCKEDGDYVFIPKETPHRMRNISDTNTLIIMEVQTGTYFGEDDIVRFEDKYGR
jgi:mannose-1-phosphate guanylyltransferase/mannose-6-phosphate isomerase